jgi:Tfp pilus assembly protein PilV
VVTSAAGRRDGFGLVEVIIATLLVAVGLLSVAGAGSLAVRRLREAESEQAAALEGAAVIDSLTQHGQPLSGTAVSGRLTHAWTVLDSAGISTVTLRVSWNDGGAPRTLLLSAWAAPPPPLSHAP